MSHSCTRFLKLPAGIVEESKTVYWSRPQRVVSSNKAANLLTLLHLRTLILVSNHLGIPQRVLLFCSFSQLRAYLWYLNYLVSQEGSKTEV